MKSSLSCLSFRDVRFDVVDRDGQPWLQANQVGQALGYSRPAAINTLYQSNADEFTDAMTALVRLHHGNDDAGQLREVRIFSLRGCHLLGMFARTAIAKDFRKWVLDVLDQQAVNLPVNSLPILESSLVLDFQGVPIRLLIDESGSWMAAYRDVATALGYINKEQQWSARNMLLYTAKSADRQLRHPLYGDLIALTGIDRIVASLKRNAASDPDRASRAGSFRAWLATVAYPLVANPASAGLLLSQRWTPPAALALERDPDYEQTARVLKLWHQDLGESAYRAADVLASATADFAAALAEVASGRWFSAVLSAKRLGKWLAVRQGQAVDGLKIVGGVERNQKIKLWAVRESA